MKRLLGTVVAIPLLWAASVMPSSALSCSAGCFGIIPSPIDPSPGAFGDFATPASIVDDFVFSLTGPPPNSWVGGTDTITVPNALIGSLTLSVFNLFGGGPALYTTSAFVVNGGTQSITLNIPKLLSGLSYYVEVTGTSTPGTSYTGNISLSGSSNQSTPLPAAVTLMASGLGLLGFWSRRRKRGSEANMAAA